MRDAKVVYQSAIPPTRQQATALCNERSPSVPDHAFYNRRGLMTACRSASIGGNDEVDKRNVDIVWSSRVVQWQFEYNTATEVAHLQCHEHSRGWINRKKNFWLIFTPNRLRKNDPDQPRIQEVIWGSGS